MHTTVHDLVARARSRIRNLSPAEVQAHLIEGRATIVDIREPEELDEHGLIAGAFHAPRGLLEFWADPASPVHRPQLDPERHTILYCAAGSRSALAVETLRQLGYREVSHLDGGIQAWKQAGYPVAGLERWQRAGAPD